MKNTNPIGFLDADHKRNFIAALEETCSVDGDGYVSAYFGASLYLLAGLRYIWPRLKKHIGRSYIDAGSMLESLDLSTGEEMIVKLAGNLYNGDFWYGSPWDLVAALDSETFSIVLEALRLRKGKMFLLDGEVTVQ